MASSVFFAFPRAVPRLKTISGESGRRERALRNSSTAASACPARTRASPRLLRTSADWGSSSATRRQAEADSSSFPSFRVAPARFWYASAYSAIDSTARRNSAAASSELRGGLEGEAEVGMEFGSLGVQGGGALHQFESRFEMALLEFQYAQKMHGVGVIGVLGEDLAVKGSGLGNAAGLMVLLGRFKHGFKRIGLHQWVVWHIRGFFPVFVPSPRSPLVSEGWVTDDSRRKKKEPSPILWKPAENTERGARRSQFFLTPVFWKVETYNAATIRRTACHSNP